MTLLQVKNITKIYHYDDYPILRDISFCVDSGQVVTLLLGYQGGKTTLAKILTGVEKPSLGEIDLCGKPLDAVAPQNRNFAFISVPSLFGKGKVKDNLLYGLKVRGVDKKTANEILQKQLQEYDLLPFVDFPVKKLDLFQRLRLDFARAFSRKVSLLILDDCLGKDEQADAFLLKEISAKAQQGCAVLVLSDLPQNAVGKVFDYLPTYLEEQPK